MHGRELEHRAPAYVQDDEPRQDQTLRLRVFEEEGTPAQGISIHACSCGHRSHLPSTPSSKTPALETKVQVGGNRVVEDTLDIHEEHSGQSQELGAAAAKDKDPSPNPDPSIPPQRPPKDRRPPSRVTSESATILLDTLPALPRDSRNDGLQGLRGSRMAPSRHQSGIDYFVPVELDEKTSYSRLPRSKLTVSERLQPTMDAAKETREKLAKKAKNTKYIQNGAIGLQVLLGSLTTGLSAVATTGRQMAVQTTILGGLTTIVASYLAKTRNSDEAEKCRARVSELDKFIRTGTAFLLDYGHSDDAVHDKMVEEMRSDFEELLGNGAIERHQIPSDAKV